MEERDKPLEEIYFFWMDRAMKAQRKATGRLFRELGIKLTPDQWLILKRLSEKSGSSQRELAYAISKDPASITRILDLLEKEDLILRKNLDRRSFTISLTKKGEALVELVLPEAAKYRAQGIEGISKEELKIFKKVLDTIYQNFS